MKQLTRQVSSVKKTQVGINSWLESHEEKLRRVPKKFKEKIPENKKTIKRCLHRPMIMDGGEDRKLKNCVVENIEHQQKIEESDEIRDNEENRSTIYKTRSKQVSEGKW